MLITFDSNYGNFDYTIGAEIEDSELSPLAVELAKQGLANIAYRVAGSAVDKALAIDPKVGRRSVEYSEEAGEKIDASVKATLAKLEAAEKNALPKGVTFTVTGKHEFGEGGESAMVRATNLVDALFDKNEKALRDALTMFDPNAETASRASLIEIAHKAKMGISSPKK